MPLKAFCLSHYYGDICIAPLRREHRSVALRMRFGKMRTDFLCRFLQWQLRMDAPEPADGKTLAIFLHEIELGKRQRGRVFG